ncbi:type I-E CRISPR-associated protein Cas6/Cse3/CasE [Streptomyces sp. NPDC050433]|uniref:type I-E CRISPR-associated protein Cas6/Cse3/CasE n=1 Tax=unclassified Streptomyces TaxID=2593676 RepID=UPI00342C4F76
MNSASSAVTSARFVATHSVLTLNAAHPYVAKSLVDAHEMHRTVTSASARKGLRVVRAEIRGSLTVTYPPAPAQVLTQGLGQARAYSCGLLLTR